MFQLYSDCIQTVVKSGSGACPTCRETLKPADILCLCVSVQVVGISSSAEESIASNKNNLSVSITNSGCNKTSNGGDKDKKFEKYGSKLKEVSDQQLI